MKNLSYYRLLLLLLSMVGFVPFLCFSQAINVKCNDMNTGFNFTIDQFTNDSIRPKNNDLVRDRIIYPINESDACIEIRLYAQEMTIYRGRVEVVKIYKKQVVGENYVYMYHPHSYFPSDYEYLGKREGLFVYKKLFRNKYSDSSKTFLDSLKTTNIFSIRNMSRTYDSLLSLGGIFNNKKFESNCIHCNLKVLCEIKAGDNFRQFIISEWAAGIFDHKEMEEYRKNIKLFFDIFNNALYRSGQKGD